MKIRSVKVLKFLADFSKNVVPKWFNAVEWLIIATGLGYLSIIINSIILRILSVVSLVFLLCYINYMILVPITMPESIIKKGKLIQWIVFIISNLLYIGMVFFLIKTFQLLLKTNALSM